MTITQTIKIDFMRPAVPECISAVQGEDCTRQVTLELYAAGTAWQLPEGHDVSVRYGKPDGTAGTYDTLPDGSVAWSSKGNTVSVMLCPQMLSCPGNVHAQVCITVGKRLLSTFAFTVLVEADPSKGAIKSEPYYNWSKAFIPQTTGAQVGQFLQITKVDAEGRVIEVKPVDAPAAGGIDGDLDMKGCGVESVGSLDFEPSGDGYSQAFWMQAGSDIKNADGSQTAVAEFYSSESDLPVVLRHIANGMQDDDAVNVGQLKTRLIAPLKAAVGQYIQITAVDENGAVTAVEAVDAPTAGCGTNEVFVKLEDGSVVPAEAEFDLSEDNTPALVVVPDTAKVGQTIVVKAVDENGKPTEWEAVDLPAGGDEEWKLLADVTMEADTKNYSHTFVEPQRKLKVIVDSLAAEADTNYSGFQVEFDNGVNGYNPKSGMIYPRPIPAKQAARSVYYVSTYYMDKTPFVDIETFYNVDADRDVSDRRFFCRENLTDSYTGNAMIPAIRVFTQNTYGVFAAGTRYRIYGVKA